ncbi:heavy metal-associated isoprenylated plant protein 47-like isoform X1 [Alnus glutinosa]|uniref:heavy metal-associated isoprenylated plant protein 47-like isoform X1 n=1 Tax=Alnus glutinosa TaxID=3517 RepID=UPI002D782682|nr:heavy metal-associated isoprenylated plant protein 47-like isoform X1 [Alnus glutinosa]
MHVMQKIVIKVQVVCDKCRTKALKIAAAADGVVSVALEGQDKDQVVVIGNEVDVSCLTSSLRKKVGHATIVSVEEVKPKPKPDEKKKEDTSKKKVEDKDKKGGTENKCSCPTPLCACPLPCYQSQLVFYDRDPYQPPCTIM